MNCEVLLIWKMRCKYLWHSVQWEYILMVLILNLRKNTITNGDDDTTWRVIEWHMSNEESCEVGNSSVSIVGTVMYLLYMLLLFLFLLHMLLLIFLLLQHEENRKLGNSLVSIVGTVTHLLYMLWWTISYTAATSTTIAIPPVATSTTSTISTAATWGEPQGGK